MYFSEYFVCELWHEPSYLISGAIKFLRKLFIRPAVKQTPLQNRPVLLVENPFVDKAFPLRSGNIEQIRSFHGTPPHLPQRGHLPFLTFFFLVLTLTFVLIVCFAIIITAYCYIISIICLLVYFLVYADIFKLRFVHNPCYIAAD